MGAPPPPMGAPPPQGRTDLMALLALASGIGGLLVGATGLLSTFLVCCCALFGSASMLVFGGSAVLVSGVGIFLALQSKKRQSRDPTLKGSGLATAGLVLNIVSLLLALVVVVLGALTVAGMLAGAVANG